MLGNLGKFIKLPAQYEENGHTTSLRKGTGFIFDADIPALAAATSSIVRWLTGDSAILFEGGNVTINQEDVLFEIYEDVTFSAPGALNADYVRPINRIKNPTTELLLYDGPTVTDNGELVLHQHVIGVAGQNVNEPGFGSGAQDASVVFKPNTEHIFKITNNSALAAHIEVHFFFHQVEAREYS